MLERLKTICASIEAIYKGIITKASQDAKDIWNQDKAFFFLAGALILTIKFRQILINIIIGNAKDLFNSAQKQDAKDQNLENKANAQADQLVQDAQQAPAQEQPVNTDWNKKQ